jgi:hypothetical protein
MCRTTLAVSAATLALLPSLAAAQSVNMGSTFHALEAHARALTTTYPDAIVEVTRAEGGGIEVLLRDRARTLAGRLSVPAGTRRVQWAPATGGAPAEFELPAQVTVALDWAAHQAYALFTDAEAARRDGHSSEVSGDEGTWDGHVRRNRRAARAVSVGQLSARIQAVDTVFDGVVVRAALDQHERRPSGNRIDYSRFTATIHDARTGVRRGFVRWFDTAQVLTWKIEGGSQGVVTPDRLRGGWTFTPTMAWANVQAYQFATQAARSVDPAQPFAAFLPRTSQPLAQLARVVAPAPAFALSAIGARQAPPIVSDSFARVAGWVGASFGGAMRVNDPGCDNLHWLDGSIFRPCCDAHDRCYEKEGCSAGSWWWPFSGSWSCEKCNAAVVYCFCTVSNPMYCGAGSGGGSGGGSADGSCVSPSGGFCPVECQSCQSR